MVENTINTETNIETNVEIDTEQNIEIEINQHIIHIVALIKNKMFYSAKLHIDECIDLEIRMLNNSLKNYENHENVMLLFRSGYSKTEIAEITNRSIEWVENIYNWKIPSNIFQ